MYQLWLYPLSMAVVWLIWLVLVFVVGLSLSLGLWVYGFMGLFWGVSVAGDSLQESMKGLFYRVHSVHGVYIGLHDSTCVYKLLLNGSLY